MRIKVQSVLPYSRYHQALELIDEEELPLSDIRQSLEQWLTRDAPPGAARGFLQSLDAAKTSTEFRKALVASYRAINFAEVSDDGEGMSGDDLETIFLTIGTRSRRKEKGNWDPKGGDPSRPLLEVHTGDNTRVSRNVNPDTMPNTDIVRCRTLGPGC